MINCIINAKKTIVGTTEDIYFYRRILAIMAIDIKAKTGDLPAEYKWWQKHSHLAYLIASRPSHRT